MFGRGPRARPLDGFGVLALLGCVLILLGIGAASVWQADQNRHAIERARGTRAELTMLTDILIATQDAETGQRGYLLTTNRDYLRPYLDAARMMPGLLAAQTALHGSDARVNELQQAVRRKFSELAQTIRLADAGDFAGALSLVRTNMGHEEMVRIRSLVSNLQAELDEYVAQQVGNITRSDHRIVIIDTAGLLTIIALGGLIAVGLRKYLARLRDASAEADRAYAALARNNEQLDETVRARTADLTAANEEIQRFAYIVSHDLRAPLVNIMGFTSELEQASTRLADYVTRGEAPPEVREAAVEDIPEALRFIRSSSSKMDRLINAILKLSREGRRVLTPERLDMGALFAGIVDSLTHQAISTEAEVVVGAVPSVVGDRLAIEQVFGNIIDNALKYLKPGRPGIVRVTGQPAGAMARFEISDNGRGIAERDFERVFELFRRAGDQTVPGEGIGLAHVRALVRRLGGSIDCRSKLGEGTTFTIMLPLEASYSRGLVA